MLGQDYGNDFRHALRNWIANGQKMSDLGVATNYLMLRGVSKVGLMGYGRTAVIGLLANSALPAKLCAVFAVFAVLARVTGIGPCAGGCKKAFGSRQREKRQYQGQKEARERSRLNHRVFSSVAVSCTSDPP